MQLTVKQAISNLSNVCDGARSHDNQGFNGADFVLTLLFMTP